MDDSEDERRKREKKERRKNEKDDQRISEIRSKQLREYYPEIAWIKAINKCELLAYELISRFRNKRYSDPGHLVGDAIGALFEGKRAWRPAELTLEQHLFYIMKSLIKNRLRIDADEIEPGISEDSSPLSPEDLLSLSESNKAQRSALVNLVKELGEKGDSLSCHILNVCMNEPFLEYKKNSELAEYLNVPIKEIENAKKRINRINRITNNPKKGDLI